MKNLIGLIVFIFLTELCYCQTINSLDTKRGFDVFKLDDNFNKWKSLLVFERVDNSGTVYKYTGNTPKMLFNEYPIYAIYLKFKSEKLVDINIILQKFETENTSERVRIYKDCSESLDFIAVRFKMLFGVPTTITEPKKKVGSSEIEWTMGIGWIADKTTLYTRLTFWEISAVCVLSVQIVDNANFEKSLLNGF